MSGPRAVHSRRARHGSTLVELLAALPIIGIVGTLALLLLIATQRQARRSDTADAAVRELRHAGVILGAELRPLRAADVIAWSDTSFEFQALVGTGIACGTRTPGASVHVLPAGDVDPLETRWVMPLQDGDRVRVMLASTTIAGEAIAWEALARTVASSTGCAGSMLLATGGSALQIALDAPPPSSIAEGTPVRITRRTRYHLYRAGDGFWYLGRASRGRSVWEGVQPVAGPFTSASSHGVRFTARDTAGTVLATGSTSAVVSVHVELRAARIGVSTAADSSFIAIALRAHDD